MTTAQEILRPGDVLCVRTGGLAGEVIRVGEELSGKDGACNHVAVFHHWDSSGTPWFLEGRPGGVGWADGRPYLASPYSVNNCAQPGRDDASRAAVAAEAEHLLDTAYSWASIADDTLRCFHMPDLFGRTVNGTVPTALVCSSFCAFLYERAGWACPLGRGCDCEPSDWVEFCLVNGYSVSLRTAGPAGARLYPRDVRERR